MSVMLLPRDFFEHLLNCLANQRFIAEDEINDCGGPQGAETRRAMQAVIDEAWAKGMDMLDAEGER